jgi:hypothetical protein
MPTLGDNGNLPRCYTPTPTLAFAVAVLTAVDAKDFGDIQTAFKSMTGACAACHKEYKK